MDRKISLAIRRVLDRADSRKVLHVSDLVVALRWMIPEVQHDEATALEHLTLMIDDGYEPPVAVVLD